MARLPLTPKQQAIHDRAKIIFREYTTKEWDIISILQEAEASRVWKSLGYGSLYKYCMGEFGLDEKPAYAFVKMSEKVRQFPKLAVALCEQTLTFWKANRIVPALTEENSEELIKFAQTHSKRAIEFEVAKRNPKAATQERVKFLSGDLVELTVVVSKECYEEIARAQSLTSKKERMTRGKALEICVKDYVYRKDPVHRAERAMKRAAKRATRQPEITTTGQSNKTEASGFCPGRKPKRVSLKAEENHATNLRDKTRCTFIEPNGERCDNDCWTEKHHIQSVADGGSNHPQNLTTLCWVHHDLVHQLSLPLEGQVTWLRDRQRPYRAVSH